MSFMRLKVVAMLKTIFEFFVFIALIAVTLIFAVLSTALFVVLIQRMLTI